MFFNGVFVSKEKGIFKSNFVQALESLTPVKREKHEKSVEVFCESVS